MRGIENPHPALRATFSREREKGSARSPVHGRGPGVRPAAQTRISPEGLAGSLRQRIGEAVAERQPGGIAAAPAEVAVCGAGDKSLFGGDRLDQETRFRHDVVEAPAGDGVAPSVDDDGRLEKGRRRNAFGIAAPRERPR